MTTLNALHMTRVKDSVPVKATPVLVRQLSEYTQEYYRQQGSIGWKESGESDDKGAASSEGAEGCPCEDKEKGWNHQDHVILMKIPHVPVSTASRSR